MLTKLTNMIGKIKYALYGVKLNAQNFLLSHEYPHRDVCATYHLRNWWHFAQNHARHWPSDASVHRCHELGRFAAAFLLIICSQTGSDWTSTMWQNKRKTGICRFRRLIVSHAWWAAAGALHRCCISHHSPPLCRRPWQLLFFLSFFSFFIGTTVSAKLTLSVPFAYCRLSCFYEIVFYEQIKWWWWWR